MEKLQKLSEYLKNKHAEGDVFTVPLSESAKILQAIFTNETKCIMLFTSDKNKDGKQWCSYCVNVKPYYNQIYEEVSKIKLPLYVFIVGDQPTWKDPNHSFRKNKLLQVTSVPTFGFFNGKKLVNKIGGSEMVQQTQRCLVYDQIKIYHTFISTQLSSTKDIKEITYEHQYQLLPYYIQQSSEKSKMGGDSFQGVQKLSNAEYQQITTQLLARLKPFCKRIKPYIPLPEKQIHGDVDFLVILKEPYQQKDIVNQLKMEKYILNNNSSINSVYKNKQVDYSFVQNDQQFQLASFYKSYSGVGALLGLFLPTKQIKITTKGIFALGYHKHLKIQVNICDKVDEILEFYGLDFARYKQGFKTRKELFQYLRNVRFLDEEKFAYHEHKNSTKLIKGLEDYLKSQGINKNKKIDIYENPLEQTLKYFNKKEKFDTLFEQKINSAIRLQDLNQKFNATHLFEVYEISKNEMNEIKKKFNQLMFDGDMKKYYDWVETHDVKQILKAFEQKCGLKPKSDEKLGQK